MHSAGNTNSRKQRKARTRQAILEAAIDIFAERGFEAASMADIAKRSGTKKALIQYHFETKENLWKAAVNELWRQRVDALPQYLDITPGVSQQDYIRAILKQLIRYMADRPAWITLMIQEASNPGPRLNWFIETHLREDYQKGIDMVMQAQRDKLLPQGSALQILHILSGALSYMIYVAPITEQVTGIKTDAQFFDSYVDTLLDMLDVPQARLRPASPPGTG